MRSILSKFWSTVIRPVLKLAYSPESSSLVLDLVADQAYCFIILALPVIILFGRSVSGEGVQSFELFYFQIHRHRVVSSPPCSPVQRLLTAASTSSRIAGGLSSPIRGTGRL